MIKPRLKTSLKRQDFPVDYTKMITKVIGQNFKKHLTDKKVVVQGFIYPAEITIRIGFVTEGGIKQINFEASVEYSMKSKNIMDQIYLGIDALGSMIDEYFKAAADIELPTVWQPFTFDTKTVYLQTSTENSELEKKANDLLKAKGLAELADEPEEADEDTALDALLDDTKEDPESGH